MSRKTTVSFEAETIKEKKEEKAPGPGSGLADEEGGNTEDHSGDGSLYCCEAGAVRH